MDSGETEKPATDTVPKETQKPATNTVPKKGQKVKTKDILGTVADDGSGNCTLHFQLRKDTNRPEPAKLNPEAWIGK